MFDLGAQAGAAPDAPPAPAVATMSDRDIEDMAERILSSRSFQNSQEVRKFAHKMANGPPGRTPRPADILPPPVERAMNRRIAALVPDTIAE